MKLLEYPERHTWTEISRRPDVNREAVMETVRTILQDVKSGGDKAVTSFTEKFDKILLKNFEVGHEEIEGAENKISAELKKAIQQAKKNIESFHISQVEPIKIIETAPGIQCWRKNVPIQKIGLYIPGGSAPLFSTVLMLGIPAMIAGCTETILCTPCNEEGKIHSAILYAAHITGIKKIFRIGGAQAIASMAYGTASVPSVYKIFGPGNQYVTAAKQLVQLDGIAIDMPAGPSEVCILADDSAHAAYIAADLLAQAEHGPDSQVLLVTTSEVLVKEVKAEVEKQMQSLPRKEIVIKSLEHSKIILLKSMEEAIELVNEYATEHLIIHCKEAENISEKIINAGSVFIGKYSPESAGDYASGTNHTLPTNGFAKSYSGVSVDSFVKKITFQKLTEQGLNHVAQTVIDMAEAEGLQAHANAVKIRNADL